MALIQTVTSTNSALGSFLLLYVSFLCLVCLFKLADLDRRSYLKILRSYKKFSRNASPHLKKLYCAKKACF